MPNETHTNQTQTARSRLPHGIPSRTLLVRRLRPNLVHGLWRSLVPNATNKHVLRGHQRGVVLVKRSPLKRGDSQLKRTPLKQRSDRRSGFMKETRAPLVGDLVARGVRCEIGPLLDQVGLGGGCGGKISGLHERRKRSSGGSLTNPANLIPACSWCNGQVEDQAGPIRDLTGDMLVVREGDPEWESLSARLDRF